jgi:hypothetical protein
VTISIADPRLSGRVVRRIVFNQQQIATRVREMGDEIAQAYPDGDLLVLGLLKGSFIFLSDLVREIRRPLDRFPRCGELRGLDRVERYRKARL